VFSIFRRPPQILVRALEAADASACAAIHASCFAHSWPSTEIEAMATSVNSIAHAAVEERSGEILGFIISRKILDEGEVLTVAVNKEHRKQGVAAGLLEVHLSALMMARVRQLFLEVDETNAPARALYAKFGFVEKGRREGYYRMADGTRASALILRKDVI
jgi:[ribosomal protein S18]-alanine N-acetyltransferase